MRRLLLLCGSIGFVACAAYPSLAGNESSTERGRAAVHVPLNPAVFSQKAYDQAWKQWGLKEKPADYDRLFRERYGLWEAPYANQALPMGFHEARGLLGKGVGNDCLLCHAGTVAGQTVVGLGNASIDLQSLYEDLAAGDGIKNFLSFTFANVRGTIEGAPVVGMLLQFRDPDVNLRAPIAYGFKNSTCEKIPPWWNLRKKQSMYWTGSTDTRSVRTINTGDWIKKQTGTFADIRDYLKTLEPPRYPFPVDTALAARGKVVFENTCSKCHGTYGPGGSYPNKVVPPGVIGTDRTLLETFPPEAVEHLAKSWFFQEKGPDGQPYERSLVGYQAPPLDGVWATAPYLHNGSAPTVYHVLNSKARPKAFTRSYRTGREDYDSDRLGWRITVVERVDPSLPLLEQRKVYDTTQPGRGNGGHTFGDDLNDADRMAVIEYLKTL